MAGDRQGVVGAEHEHRDVGAEELGDLDGRALDDGVEVGGVRQDGDDLGQAGRAKQRLRGVALRRLEALAQFRVRRLQARQRRRRLNVLRLVHNTSRATLELWMPVDPVMRANSPTV